MSLIDVDKDKMIAAFYKRLLDVYGYTQDLLSIGSNVNTENDIDIAIWRTKEAKIKGMLPNISVAVVCSIDHVRVKADEYLQMSKMAKSDMTFFLVIHNNKETRAFFIDRSRGGHFETIADFPKASDIATDESLRKYISRMRNCSKDKLLQAFNKCHNIIRSTDKLSPEAAFDEISKVLFIKMIYEQHPDHELIYTRDKFLRDEIEWQSRNKNQDYISRLFNLVKGKYEVNKLFDRNDYIKISRTSFLKILDELGNIGLSSMAEDVKGVAFESFLGKTFRGELGQFFTPRTIVNYMVDVLDVKEGELVCDPCCGSGGFLIRAFEKVQDDIDRDINKQASIIVDDLTDDGKLRALTDLYREFDKTAPNTRYNRLCSHYFYGVDANVRMARTSKMNMIMHGDGHVGVYLHDGLTDVGNVREGMFDVVLINPPFGVRVDRDILDDDSTTINELYELKSTNAEFLFIERTIRLLKPGGRAGLVLPEGVFTNNNVASRNLRKFVERNAEILNITSIPSDVFMASGANIKPSILFIRKFKEGETSNKKRSRTICVSKVTDAGINSLGLSSDNSQLSSLAPIVKEWIYTGVVSDNPMLRFVDSDVLDDWNIHPLFNVEPIRFKSGIPVERLSRILHPSQNQIILEDDVYYTRITVKLFNRGIIKRDNLLGKEIGTKKQTLVKKGQFIISKIDGKSGAFAILPDELDNSIVTPDFPVFDIDTAVVVPQYLELVLNNPSMLNIIKETCSGSTGRRRLSVSKFLNMQIPLPPLEQQNRLLKRLRELQASLTGILRGIDDEIINFNNNIFC